ncbi:thioesterase family protein [Oceaniserpentilla sp. 4NH20-0058]|uniref:acyl-CoA thioesterase n=1 Tax=Oceaniserpentilla sp. 4NH20-0058 TaxID=3127660 RepID=UPI00310BF48C
MNLYFRLFLIFIRTLRKKHIPIDDLANSVSVRVLPNDLDLNMHVNNGRYLTFCDLTRVDLFIRSGLASLMIKNKWNPIIAEHSMEYIRPLNLFDKVEVSMKITHWDEKFFYCTHEFHKDEKLIAKGTSRALVISKQGSLSPEFILQEVDTYQMQKNPQR